MEAKIKMKQIDAALLQKMLIGGAKRLEANKEYINELNVFPVPDGDTGTNMTMTALAAAKEVGNAAEVTVKEVTRGLSSGSLRGARGNSGVILSQLFRGFYKGVKDQDVLTTETVAAGFKKAVETAYKAVMKPKEGTILTVAKGAYEKAAEYAALQTSAEGAAKRGYVDQIISAADTRKYVIGAFEMLFSKREDRPAKKHGTV